MKKALRFYDLFEERLLAASLAFTVILVFIQVIMRYVFNNSLSWSEELARYIFIWQIWYGISIAIRKKKHIQVELIFKIAKGKGETTVRWLIYFLNIGFCVFMTATGLQIVFNLMQKNTLSPAMGIPLWLVYVSLPASFLISGIRYALEPFQNDNTGTPPEMKEVD